MNYVLKRYTKELLAIFAIIISTVIIASYITSSQLKSNSNELYLKKLSVLKNTLKGSVENYFNNKINIIQTISQTSDTKNAMEQFNKAFNNLNQEYNENINNKKFLNLLKEHQKRVFYNTPNSPKKKALDRYLASTNNGKILQTLYVANNPFESSNRTLFFNSNQNLSYDKIHKKQHPKFVELLKRNDFYDIFLINTQGDIIYSSYKELDLGTNLKNGVYKNSSLAKAYKNSIKNNKVSFGDFKPYEPSYNKPSAFFTTPIKKDNKIIGVIAFQISIKEINNIMTFNKDWKNIGLGSSGESYLVGDDYFMRSDSRFILDTKNKLVNDLSTTVGVLKIDSVSVKKALKGEIGNDITKDYRGVRVLSSFSSVDVLGSNWALIVEIDKSEINKEINKTIFTILTTGIILVILFMIFLGFILLRLIIKPIENFEKNLDKKVEQKTKDLKESTAILNDYKKAVDEATIVSKTDSKGIIKYVNKAFCEISGFKEEELIGKPHNIVRHPNNPKSIFEEIWRTIKNKRVWKGIIKNRKKDGGEYIVQSTIVPILDDNSNIVEFISIRTDITDLIKKDEIIKEQITDELTKLPNKIKLLEDISESKDKIKLAILQIDKLKEINDFYGYEKGDLVIINITSILKRIVNKNYTIYKINSAEFAIISNKNISIDNFIKTLDNVIKYCDHNVIAIGNDMMNISITVGVSEGIKNKIFFNSELALRKAVEKSQSLLSFKETDDIQKEYENNILMTKKIKEAIKKDNIEIFGQPIKTNFDGGKSKFECLIRMYDQEQEKIISPFFFLDIAKKARLYPTLTKIVIEKSFEHFKDKKDEFSINLSIEDILTDDIVIFLKKKIEYYKIGHRVVLEIVESEGIENFEDVHSFIKEFKGYGCKIAIDDFGTGYSNFEYLMKLDIDYLKIDGSLIKNIDTDEGSELIVELMVNFAKKMGIKTIAEFIHNKNVYEKIKQMGIDYSQGYYLGEPKNLKDIIE